jgi:hypothetical protein
LHVPPSRACHPWLIILNSCGVLHREKDKFDVWILRNILGFASFFDIKKVFYADSIE